MRTWIAKLLLLLCAWNVMSTVLSPFSLAAVGCDQRGSISSSSSDASAEAHTDSSDCDERNCPDEQCRSPRCQMCHFNTVPMSSVSFQVSLCVQDHQYLGEFSYQRRLAFGSV